MAKSALFMHELDQENGCSGCCGLQGKANVEHFHASDAMQRRSPPEFLFLHGKKTNKNSSLAEKTIFGRKKNR